VADLSVLIPARQEEFLKNTVEDILAHAQGSTEVIVVLDGAWADPPLEQHPNVQIVHVPEAIGQRAATNLAAKISTAKYLMKADAHVSFDEGFDVKLMEAGDALGHDVTQIPAQKNLHVFNWRCQACGDETYQGPSLERCEKCQSSQGFDRVMVWKPRRGTTTTSWRADHTLHFQYDGDGQRKQTGDICDVMTSLGACFFMERERFWELGGLDEDHGSWGNFGIEIAFKSWLSGGRHIVNRRTWFAHLFRTRADFSFPYQISGADQDYARRYSRNLWMGNRWPGQTRPLSWLIDKFAPLKGWHEPVGAADLAQVHAAGVVFDRDRASGLGHALSAAGVIADVAGGHVSDASDAAPCPVVSDGAGHETEPESTAVGARTGHPSRGAIYYSDCRPDSLILEACRGQLLSATGGLPIVSCTLKPVGLGLNIVLPLERGYLTMARQILIALEMSSSDVIFFAEHDIAYHASHFQFVPPRDDCFYYNQNVWKVDVDSGRALFYYANQLSGLCAYRPLLLEHFRARVAKIEKDGFTRSMGFEPGTRKIRHGGIDDRQFATWMSDVPNIDIRHRDTLTPSRWKKELFRNQRYTAGWTEADAVPGWGHTKGRFREMLAGLAGVACVTG